MEYKFSQSKLHMKQALPIFQANYEFSICRSDSIYTIIKNMSLLICQKKKNKCNNYSTIKSVTTIYDRQKLFNSSNTYINYYQLNSHDTFP